MNFADFLTDFYPASKVSTGFGWDIGPPTRAELDPSGAIWPRIHYGTDRHGAGLISCPINTLKTKWVRQDGNGNSVLRLIGDGVEVRMYHLNEPELDSSTRALVLQGLPIDKGATIGPSGNTGRSFGRHLHYEVIAFPGTLDDALRRKYADLWDADKVPFYIDQYGGPFVRDVKKYRIRWMNDLALCRIDPYMAREVYLLDSRSIFGL